MDTLRNECPFEKNNFIRICLLRWEIQRWEPKMVKLKIEQNDDKVKSIFYMRDFSPVEV